MTATPHLPASDSETNIIEVIEDFYESFDRVVKTKISTEPISCLKGCHGCCFQMIGVSPGEAIHILSKLAMTSPDIRGILRRCLSAASTLASFKQMGECFRRGIPCVFLKSGLCQIYQWRPATCRYYFVVSPAEDCYPSDPPKGVFHLDAHIKAGESMLEITKQLLKSNPGAFIPPYGPLPAMLLWAAAAVFKGGDKIWAQKKLAKLPPLWEWKRFFDQEGPSLDEEADEAFR